MGSQNDKNRTYIYETVLISGSTNGIDNFISGGTFNTNTGDLNLVTISGDTITVNLDGRYSLSGFTDNSSDWNSAYDNSITGVTVTGTTNKTLTLQQQDGGVLQANFVDLLGGGTGDAITGMTFNSGTGDLSLYTVSGNTITEDLDGRYLLSSDYTPGDSNTDDYITGATFNSGILQFTRLSGGTFNVDLDDRYSVTGHTHTVSEITNFPTDISDFNNDVGYIISGPIIFSSETSGTTTYVGYGEVNACKIRQIITISGSTYTAYWSNGEETLNKIWVNRLSYPYF